MGFGGHDPLGQHPGAISRKSSEAVFEAAAAAPGFSRCRVGVLTGVGVAEVARTCVGDIGGVDLQERPINKKKNHGHHVILDAVLVPGSLTTDEHFGSHLVGVTGDEGVLTVGLLEAMEGVASAHVDRSEVLFAAMRSGDGADALVSVLEHGLEVLDNLTVARTNRKRVRVL